MWAYVHLKKFSLWRISKEESQWCLDVDDLSRTSVSLRSFVLINCDSVEDAKSEDWYSSCPVLRPPAATSMSQVGQRSPGWATMTR